jgi:hypothetical protein
MALTRPRIALVAVVGLVALVAGALSNDYVRLGGPVAVAHVAKKLCSAAFVAHLDPEAVWSTELRGLVTPLGPLMRRRIDRERGVVEVVTPIASARALYRGALGCTLIVERSEEELRLEGNAVAAMPPAELDPAGPWPEGGAGPGAVPAGVDAGALGRALDHAFAEPGTSPRNTSAVLIAKDGVLVAERYARGHDARTRLHGWSLSKTVTTLLAAHLVQEGRLSLEGRAPLPALRDAADARRDITVEQLMRMTPGLAFVEDYRPGSDSTRMLYLTADQARYAATRPMVARPGEAWNYSTGTTNILARVVQDAEGGSLGSAYRYMQESFFQPLHMRSVVIEPDASGTFVGGAYTYMIGRDWLRLGQLLLQEGVADGRRLLPEGFVARARTPTPGAPEGQYGGSLWLNAGDPSEPARRLFKTLPREVYLGWGHDGQHVVVVPSHGLVIARFGYTPLENEASGLETLIGEAMAALPAAAPGRADGSPRAQPPF